MRAMNSPMITPIVIAMRREIDMNCPYEWERPDHSPEGFGRMIRPSDQRVLQSAPWPSTAVPFIASGCVMHRRHRYAEFTSDAPGRCATTGLAARGPERFDSTPRDDVRHRVSLDRTSHRDAEMDPFGLVT